MRKLVLGTLILAGLGLAACDGRSHHVRYSDDDDDRPTTMRIKDAPDGTSGAVTPVSPPPAEATSDLPTAPIPYDQLDASSTPASGQPAAAASANPPKADAKNNNIFY